MFFYCIVFMAFCGMSENQQVTSTKKIAADNKIVLYAATLSCNVGVDVEFVLPCRSDPLGRYGDPIQSRCSGGRRPALIAYQFTAKSQVGVDYRGQNTVKFVQNEKYSAKSADFLRFLLYLCHVIDDFACLDLQH